MPPLSPAAAPASRPPSPPHRTVRAIRVGRAWLTREAGRKRYILPDVKGRPAHFRIGKASKLTGLSTKTLTRYARSGVLPCIRPGTYKPDPDRLFTTIDLYRSKIFILGHAAKFFGLKYSRVRYLYRPFMQQWADGARGQGISYTYRISLVDLCNVLNGQQAPAAEHLALVDHQTERSTRARSQSYKRWWAERRRRVRAARQAALVRS